MKELTVNSRLLRALNDHSTDDEYPYSVDNKLSQLREMHYLLLFETGLNLQYTPPQPPQPQPPPK